MGYVRIIAGILDDAGFGDVRIFASGDVDEFAIEALLESGAPIDAFGVGTRLGTSSDAPSLGGVYKLGAVRTDGGGWRDVIKLSEQSIKISTPGIQQVRRYTQGGALVADVIYDAERGMTRPPMYWDLEDPARAIPVGDHDGEQDLLVPIVDRGALVAPAPSVHDVRARALAELAALSPRTRRFLVDFSGGDLAYWLTDPKAVEILPSTTQGKITAVSLVPNLHGKGFRAAMEVRLDQAGQSTELRAFLRARGQTLTETWTYPWKAA